jgi:hypothetical protein
MLTIEELLERSKRPPSRWDQIRRNPTNTGYTHIRFYEWSELQNAIQLRLRKVPSLLNTLGKYRGEMDADELELFDSLVAEQKENESNGNLSWTRISLHMDTLDILEKASNAQKMSKSELAEIAIREYCKAIGIE